MDIIEFSALNDSNNTIDLSLGGDNGPFNSTGMNGRKDLDIAILESSIDGLDIQKNSSDDASDCK